MQYKAIALSALAAAVSAQETSDSPNVVSIISVLQTALPSSLLQGALTNSQSVISQVASEFAAGTTPTWYSALPTDIQTYLNPTGTEQAVSVVSELSASLSDLATVTSAPGATGVPANLTTGTYAVGNATAVSASQSAILSSIASQNGSTLSNTTVTRSTLSRTLSGSATTSAGGADASSSGSSSGSDSDSSSSSSAGAMPTAVYGMSLAGAAGLVGLLAL